MSIISVANQREHMSGTILDIDAIGVTLALNDITGPEGSEAPLAAKSLPKCQTGSISRRKVTTAPVSKIQYFIKRLERRRNLNVYLKVERATSMVPQR